MAQVERPHSALRPRNWAWRGRKYLSQLSGSELTQTLLDHGVTEAVSDRISYRCNSLPVKLTLTTTSPLLSVSWPVAEAGLRAFQGRSWPLAHLPCCPPLAGERLTVEALLATPCTGGAMGPRGLGQALQGQGCLQVRPVARSHKSSVQTVPDGEARPGCSG